MLTDKYKKEFISAYNVTDGVATIIKNIQEVETETNIPLVKWNLVELSKFFEKIDSISPATFSKKFIILRSFGRFIAEKEGIKYNELSMENIDYFDLINKDKLLASILSKAQYEEILHKLDEKYGRNTNSRNKLLLELAWEGLTAEEMKLLKMTDIEFKDDIAILHLKDGKDLMVDNQRTIEDMKLCIHEHSGVQIDKNDMVKSMPYRSSEYLLKPFASGRSALKAEYIGNPQATFRNIFRNSINCKGIDMESLSLQDVRRSKLIFLLSDKGDLDVNFVSIIFGITNSSSLLWLERIAEEKYKINK